MSRSSFLKFKLTVAYDGTGYAGWQTQKAGIGVQQRLEEALARIFPSIGRVHSSSRTDTGVHALGMVVHVDIPQDEFKMTARKLSIAINANLPPDIRVMDARPCSANFHARFQATGKQYRYVIWNHRAMNPLLRHYAWHVPVPLDLDAMRAAATQFVGKHDFCALAATRVYRPGSTVRTLTRCEFRRSGPMLTFYIEGDGFLYKMCRGIVGTIVQVGEGKIGSAAIQKILDSKDRRVAGVNAPAHGLVLWKVFYKKPAKDHQQHTQGHGPEKAEG